MGLYGLLLAYQIVLLADTIRTHAFDWWKWLLALMGIATLTTPPQLQDVAGFRFPWLSFIVAVATSAVTIRLIGRPPRSTVADQIDDLSEGPGATTPGSMTTRT